MVKHILVGICLLSLGVHGQWSNFMAGFNPLQGMNLGLQNLGANIRAMTQNIVTNSINQAQTSFQSSIANAIQRAEADGTRFDFQTELRAGEFRQFTDQTGTTRGFYHRSSDGLTTTFMLFSSGSGYPTFLFSYGPRGNQVITF